MRRKLRAPISKLYSGSRWLKGLRMLPLFVESCCRFHQRFTSNFCVNISVPKKLQSQTVTIEKLQNAFTQIRPIKMLMKLIPNRFDWFREIGFVLHNWCSNNFLFQLQNFQSAERILHSCCKDLKMDNFVVGSSYVNAFLHTYIAEILLPEPFK